MGDQEDNYENQNTQIQSDNQNDLPSVHSYMIFFTFLTIGHIGLWALAFRDRKCSKYVHMTCLLIVTILCLMTGFLALNEWGVQNKFGNVHTGIGITTIIVFVLQCVCGFVTLLGQKRLNFQAHIVIIWNYIHRILGWLLYFLMMVPIMIPAFKNSKIWMFSITPVVCFMSYVGYFLFNFFRKRIQSLNIAKLEYKQLKTITVEKLLERYPDYFIFADYVYLLDGLLATHPGGSHLIQAIRGKQADRFLYGIQSPQTVQTLQIPFFKKSKVMMHHHTLNSIKLAGEPIFKLQSDGPFENMGENNIVKVYFQEKLCDNLEIYLVYLSGKNVGDKFIYKGYTKLSQLGKYFTLTINNKISRLYTMVNFFHQSNLKFYTKIMKKQLNSSFNQQQSQIIKNGLNKFTQENPQQIIWEENDNQNQQKNQQQQQYQQNDKKSQKKNKKNHSKNHKFRNQKSHKKSNNKSNKKSNIKENNNQNYLTNKNNNKNEVANEVSNEAISRTYFENELTHQMQPNYRTQHRMQTSQKQNCIPLLIKKVQYGQFTSKLFQKDHRQLLQIKMSHPRGIGLHLSTVPQGQIIIFAGGTGINCFYDTFDLLFKQMLIKQQKYSQRFLNQLKQKDPILKKPNILASKYKFKLFYSITNQNQLIQQFAYILNQLSSYKYQDKHRVLQVRLRISDGQISQQFSKKYSKNYPNIDIIQDRFNKQYGQIKERKDQISQIYVCGPHRLTYGVYKDLIKQNFDRRKYTFM